VPDNIEVQGIRYREVELAIS